MKGFTAKDIKLITAVKEEMTAKFLRVLKEEFPEAGMESKAVILNIVKKLEV